MSEHYERLDAAMRRRYLDLGMKTWRDLAQTAGISYETLRALRKGEGKSVGATIHGLERALRWETGSIEQVLAGGDPTPIGALPPLSAQATGSVTAEAAEDPLAAQFRALLEQAQERTNERLAELADEVSKVKEENQELRKLLDDRKGA